MAAWVFSLCILLFGGCVVPIARAQTTAPAAVPISRVDDSKYTVEPNVPYGSHSFQVMDIIYPKNAGPNGTTKLPGVVMFHGGGWIETTKASMSTFYNRFLAHGFVVCNVEYRMAGKDKSGNYTADSALAPAAVEDALTATKWFWDHADHYNVDKTRFVVNGASAGGHLSLMVGMCTPEAKLGPTNPTDFKIAAIVNGYGPADMVGVMARNDGAAKQWIPLTLADRDEIIKRVNPLTYVRKDIPPLLTVIGSKDPGLAGNQKMVDMLKAVGADAQVHVVQGAGHGFSVPLGTWPDAEQAMFTFLADKKIIQQPTGAP